MSRAKIVQEEMKQNGATFYALRLETRNANIVLLSEGEDQLGTLAAAIPPTDRMLGPPVSSILLGDRNTIVARLLAERLAQRTGKIALASVFSRTTDDREKGQLFIQLFEKALGEEKRSTEKK